MKSAYERALEKMDQQGIERPQSDALSDAVKTSMAEARNKAEARLAELEILFRDRVAATQDLSEREQAEKNYWSERGRIESQRDRELKKLRKRNPQQAD